MTVVFFGSAVYGLAAGVISGALILFFATFLGTAAMAYRRAHRGLFEVCQWSICGAYVLAVMAPVWFLQPSQASLDDDVRAVSAASMAFVFGLAAGVWLIARVMRHARELGSDQGVTREASLDL